jgi:hypothetical protein
MIIRKSDQLIVLRGRESRPHIDGQRALNGEGADKDMQLAKETSAGQAGSENR